MSNLDRLSPRELIHALQSLDGSRQSTETIEIAAKLVASIETSDAEIASQERAIRDAHDALEESRSRYADLYDLAPVGYCVMDRNGVMSTSNFMLAALLGTERTQLEGYPFAMYVAPEDRSVFRTTLGAALQGDKPTTFEVALEDRRTHERLPVQVVLAHIRDRDGGVIGCRAAVMDVSKRKHSEEALRIQADVSELLTSSLDYGANLLRVAQRLVPDFARAVLIDLVEGHAVRRLVELSVVGDVPDLVERRVIWTPTPGSAIDRVLCGGPGMVVAPTEALGPTRNAVRANGAVLVAPIASHDKVFGAVTLLRVRERPIDDEADLAVLQDLGLRMAMAIENGRLFEDATRAIQTREDVLAIVCHDLRNPLNAIRTGTDVLLLNAPEADRRSGRRQLEAIKRGTERMGRMIGDLLDMSSIEAGRFYVDPGDVPVAQIVADVLDVLGPTASRRDQTVLIEVPPESLTVRCDRERMLQVLQNVVANAIKFTPAGGRIEIRATPDGSMIQFDVVDDGPGIEAERLLHIFDRYWQAPETAHKGRGLGLYISKGIIEAMGGRIWAESTPGHGTTVSWALPCAAVDADADAVETEDGKTKLVLLVDDEADNREAVRDVLESEGHPVIEARNGAEALELMRAERPALVLLDLRMPVLDGWAVLEARMADPELQTIPVVLVSGTRHLRDEAMRAKADGFLEKPVRLESLIEVVARYARSGS